MNATAEMTTLTKVCCFLRTPSELRGNPPTETPLAEFLTATVPRMAERLRIKRHDYSVVGVVHYLISIPDNDGCNHAHTSVELIVTKD